MPDKIKIQSQAQFDVAVGSVQSSMQIMGSFDWDHLCKSMEFGEGVGAVFKPEVFKQIQADPQWELKKRLFRAARTFVAEVEAVGEAMK